MFLPYDAFISVDAIARTLVRLLITGNRLLEWQTSSEAERTARSDIIGFIASMWITPVIAFASGVILLFKQPDQLALALPIVSAWLVAPWIAWWISQPLVAPPPDLSDGQLAFLRRVARKTWHFFDTFVTSRENWLPPAVRSIRQKIG